MNNLTLRAGLLAALLTGVLAPAFTQPLWSTRQVIGKRIVFRDAKNRGACYYSPAPLELSVDRSGKPVFQLISLRYTGRALTGDTGEKRFTNLLQFGVNMPALQPEERAEIRAHMRLPANATLLPLPIRHLDAVVVSGLGRPDEPSEQAKRFRKRAGAQESGTEPKSGEYWTERTFTLPLDNHEAQILWDQQINGRLAVSLNYAFYADILKIRDDDLQVSGDSAFVKHVTEANATIARDSGIVTYSIYSDALNIQIDVNKYPDALKRIDLNENAIPPAYPALEVKCFDFSMDIRPDLAFKRVEIEGTSVTGQPVLIKTRFAQKSADLTSKFISFPYALRMDKPIRYRVLEVPYESDPPPAGPWQVKDPGTNLIDATTPHKENPVDRLCVDVETLPEYLEEKELDEVTVGFAFHFDGRPQVRTLTFSPAEGAFYKNVCLNYEKSQSVQYFVSRKYRDGRSTKGLLRAVPADGYVLVAK